MCLCMHVCVCACVCVCVCVHYATNTFMLFNTWCYSSLYCVWEGGGACMSVCACVCVCVCMHSHAMLPVFFKCQLTCGVSHHYILFVWVCRDQEITLQISLCTVLVITQFVGVCYRDRQITLPSQPYPRCLLQSSPTHTRSLGQGCKTSIASTMVLLMYADKLSGELLFFFPALRVCLFLCVCGHGLILLFHLRLWSGFQNVLFLFCWQLHLFCLFVFSCLEPCALGQLRSHIVHIINVVPIHHIFHIINVVSIHPTLFIS